MANKQTAVEFLVEQLKENNMLTFDEWTELFEQAKAIEKEQIESAFYLSKALEDRWENAEEYYNETYGR